MESPEERESSGAHYLGKRSILDPEILQAFGERKNRIGTTD